MPLSLHAAYVPTALQMLGTAHHLLNKAEAWGKDTGTSEGDIIRARLAEDMLPFTYQIKCVAEHTKGSLDALKAGVYSPDLNPPPGDFASLRAKLDEAVETVKGTDEEELDAMIGQPMRFEFKDARMDFLAEDFLLGFSQPNFFFHCTTAYDILRHLGAPVGKRDFLGRGRTQG